MRWLLALMLLITMGVLIAAGVLLQKISRHRAAFDAEIARHEKLGQPVFLEDLIPTGTIETQNAAHNWNIALRSVKVPTDSPLYEWPTHDGEYSQADVAIIKPLLDANSAAFAAVKQAASCTGPIDWHITTTDPISFYGDSNGFQFRGLECLLIIAARDAANRGDYALAFEKLAEFDRLLIDFGKFPELMGRLAVNEEMSCGAAEQILIHIAEDSSKPGLIVPRELIRKPIQSLLDDQLWLQLDRQALLADRISAMDEVLSGVGLRMSRAVLQQPSSRNRLRWALKLPAALDEAARLLPFNDDLLKCLNAPDFPAANVQLQSIQRFPSQVSKMAQENWIAFVKLHYMYETERHLAAVALALEWYAAEHHGSLPHALDALLPTYLTALPLDTLASSRQFEFRNDDDPVIFSTSFAILGAPPTSMPSAAGARVDRDQVYLRRKK